MALLEEVFRVEQAKHTLQTGNNLESFGVAIFYGWVILTDKVVGTKLND